MFVGLVKDPGAGWGLPDDSSPPARGRRQWSMPAIRWRALIWIAAFVLLFVLSRTVGGWAGYGLLLLAIATGSLGLDRHLGPAARGMRDYQA